jgi:hypothetical protein
MKKTILPVLFFLLIFLIGYLCLESHESQSSTNTEFFIDKPYLAVIKGMATKNSLEKIVEDNDGVVTNKNWDHFQVEVPRRVLRVKEYKLEGLLKFNVEKTDPSLGKLRLPFIQEMRLDDQVLSLRTKLAESQKHVIVCDKIVEISPILEDDGLLQRTHVSIKSELAVRKTIPFFFGKMMDDKVDQANKKDIERLKTNIINASGQKALLTIIRQGRTM